MLDLTNMTLEEIQQVQEVLAKKQEELLKEKQRARVEKAIKRNELLKAHGDVIMKLIDHIEDCDHENGFLSDYKDTYCPACHLKEIIDGEWHLHAFDVKFKVEIKELEE